MHKSTLLWRRLTLRRHREDIGQAFDRTVGRVLTWLCLGVLVAGLLLVLGAAV